MIRYSIVIPTKDRVELCNRLISTIDKAIVTSNLKKGLFELIVVDDSGVKHEYRSAVLTPKVLVCRKNVAHARNIGGSTAQGRFIIFFDDDTMVPVDYFRILDEIVSEHELDILGVRMYPMRFHAADLFFALMMVYVRRFGYLPGYNLIIRKSLFEKVHFDDSIAPSDDFKYFFDVNAYNPRVYNSKRLHVTHEKASYWTLVNRFVLYSRGWRMVHKRLPKDYPSVPTSEIIELNDDISYREKYKGIGFLMRFKLICLLLVAYSIFMFYNVRMLAETRLVKMHLKDMAEVI